MRETTINGKSEDFVQKCRVPYIYLQLRKLLLILDNMVLTNENKEKYNDVCYIGIML